MRGLPKILMAVTLLWVCPSEASPQGALSADSLTRLNRELFRAIGRERTEDVRRLVAAGASLNGDAVISAVNQSPEMGRLILELGGDPNGQGELFRMTPLSFLAVSGDAAQTRLLLEFGADPNPPTGSGAVPPLMMAAMNNNVEVAGILLEAGADPNVETPGGDSAMEWAAAVGLLTGDTRMAEMIGEGSPEGREMLRSMEGGLSVDGTHQEGFQSLSREQTTYPAGGFTGPCLSRRNPAFDPPHPNPGDTGSGSYRETHVSFVGGMKVGMITPPGCEPLQLGPAEYEVTILGGDVSWVWVCKDGSGADCKIVTMDDDFVSAVDRFQVGVEPGPEEGGEAPDEGCRVESVHIVAPGRGAQFTYDDGDPGEVRNLMAKAEASPSDCEQAYSWSIEPMGSVLAEQEVYLDAVQFNYRGLPDHNSDFGPKRITVEIGGQTDTLTVEIFFEPTATNHPGEGSGEIPNWFHYWGQTSAGRGFDPFYMQEIPPCISSGDVLLGRYEYDDNKVYLAEALARSTCPARPGAPGSTGIDCYAEIVRHETTHQREQQYWWPVEKNGIDFEPHSCFLGGMNLTAAANFYAAVDSDLDGVPDYIEAALTQTRGCSPLAKESCSGRPTHLSRPVNDNEMNAYTEGWKWVPTSANGEDWSRCGKQWTDARVCPGSKVW